MLLAVFSDRDDNFYRSVLHRFSCHLCNCNYRYGFKLLISTQKMHYFKSIHFRYFHIQNNQIQSPLLNQSQCFVPVSHRCKGIALGEKDVSPEFPCSSQHYQQLTYAFTYPDAFNLIGFCLWEYFPFPTSLPTRHSLINRNQI